MPAKKHTLPRWIAALIAVVAIPTAALADVRAVMREPANGKQTVFEVNDAGDIRVDEGIPGSYMLVTGGKGYFIGTKDGKQAVVSIEDIANALGAGKNKAVGAATEPFPGFVQKGTKTIGGRTGDVFGVNVGTNFIPMLVISRDPALKPLGLGIANQLEAMGRMLGNSSGPTLVAMLKLFREGAPLEMLGSELGDVTFDPIAPERLLLPAMPVPPETALETFKAVVAR